MNTLMLSLDFVDVTVIDQDVDQPEFNAPGNKPPWFGAISRIPGITGRARSIRGIWARSQP